MKKTIIAMLALSGVAFGASATDVNANLQKAMTDYGYQSGDFYELTTTVAVPGGSATYFTYAEGWQFYSQEQKYFGVTTGDDPGNWSIREAEYEVASGQLTNEQKQTAFDGSLTVGTSKSWLLQTGTSSYGTITLRLLCYGMAFGDQVQYMPSLVMEAGGSTWINASLLDSTGAGFALDLAQVSFGSDVQSAELTYNGQTIDLVNYVAPPSPAIPEPTTATLSLLALAGLAARRRRK